MRLLQTIPGETMKLLYLALFVSLLYGCGATKYQDTSGSITGGYSVKHMEGDIYRVVFGANGFTTRETAQTYWLYRCATLTIEKEFEGFEILSNITLSQKIPAEEFFYPGNSYKKAQYYAPIYIDDSHKPHIEADIRLLRGDLKPNPPKVFDARKLIVALEQYVSGKKCNSGNVCEHVHKYLHPEGVF